MTSKMQSFKSKKTIKPVVASYESVIKARYSDGIVKAILNSDCNKWEVTGNEKQFSIHLNDVDGFYVSIEPSKSYANGLMLGSEVIPVSKLGWEQILEKSKKIIQIHEDKKRKTRENYLHNMCERVEKGISALKATA